MGLVIFKWVFERKWEWPSNSKPTNHTIVPSSDLNKVKHICLSISIISMLKFLSLVLSVYQRGPQVTVFRNTVRCSVMLFDNIMLFYRHIFGQYISSIDSIWSIACNKSCLKWLRRVFRDKRRYLVWFNMKTHLKKILSPAWVK